MAINERECFTETRETRPNQLQCPQCRHRDAYPITWLRRIKKPRPPSNDPRDKAFFEKLRDHLFRLDDFVTCNRCRRKFEIPSHQSMVFIETGLPTEDPSID